MANLNTMQAVAVGEVRATKGEAFAKSSDGHMRRLAAGDKIFEGEVIVTANGSSAEINMFNGPALNVAEQQSVAVDSQVVIPTHDATAGAVSDIGSTEAAKVIHTLNTGDQQNLNELLDSQAPAAGLAGGDGGGGISFVDIMRIVESVPTTTYDFPTNPTGTAPTLEGQVAVSVSAGISATVSVVALVDAETHNVVEGNTATFRFSVDNAPQGDLTLTTSLGDVLIKSGTTSTDVTVNSRADDNYVQGTTTVVATVTGASGGNFASIDFSGATANVNVIDDSDVTGVTITTADVNEDAAGVTFNIALTNAPQGAASVTVHIDGEAGDRTVNLDAAGKGSLFIATANPDVYNDTQAVTATVTAINGGNFEATSVAGATATANISDTIDTVTVGIASNGDVNEATAAGFTVLVSQALDRDLTVALSNGDHVTINAGATSAAYTVPAQGDDVYVDPGSATVTISGASVAGATFENLVIDPASATANVTDTTDTVTVSIASDGDVNEATAAGFTVSVSQALDRDLTVALSNGDHVTINAGATSTAYTVPAQGDDVYVDPGSATVTISGASVAGATFENLVIDPASATAKISDTIDTVTVSIASNGDVQENAAAGFTVSVSQALDRDLTVALSNGDHVTINAGATSAAYTVPAQGDDVYVDPGHATVSISGASVAGAAFENLVISPASATANISDTIDTVTVGIASNGDVNEATAAGFTVSVSQALDRDLTVALSNGDHVTINAGATSAAYTVPAQGDDVYVDPGSATVTISGASVAGAAFENLVIDPASATAKITDTTDTVTVSIASNGDVQENAAAGFTVSVSQALDRDLTVALSNGDHVTINAGDTSTSYTVAAQGDDVYVDPGHATVSISGASVAGAAFENLVISPASATANISDTIDTVTVGIASNGDVNEATAAGFTVSVSQALDRDLTVALGNGDHVTIKAGDTSTSYTVAAQGDDVYVDPGHATVSISGASVAGAAFENLVISPASATANISDTIDTTKVLLDSVTVSDDATTITYTAHVDNAPQTAFSVTLNNGVVINFAAGSKDGSSGSLSASLEDREGTSTPLSIASTSGGNFEKLDISSTATLTVNPDVLPTLTVNDIDAYRTVGDTYGTGSSNLLNPAVEDGAIKSLSWDGMPTGYTFAQVGTTNTWEAKAGSTTFFDITLNNDGTYDFHLATPTPSTLHTSSSLMAGIVGGSNLPSYTFTADKFDDVFSLVVTGSDNKSGADTVTISATDLGINGDSIQQHFNETLKFDIVQQPGYPTASLTALHVAVSSAGSLATGDTFTEAVVYKDGTTITTHPAYDGSGIVTFNIDQNHGPVDYVTLAGESNNMNFKISGLSVDYTQPIDPADQHLNFTATATDSDGHLASDAFTVNLISGTAGNDNLVTGSTNDQVSGGAGNDTINAAAGDDVIIGGAGNDTMTGGSGADTFVFRLADIGTEAAPATDTVKDFSTSDALNLSDVLSGVGNNGVTFANQTSTSADVNVNVGGTVTPEQVIHVVFDTALTGTQHLAIDSNHMIKITS